MTDNEQALVKAAMAIRAHEQRINDNQTSIEEMAKIIDSLSNLVGGACERIKALEASIEREETSLRKYTA